MKKIKQSLLVILVCFTIYSFNSKSNTSQEQTKCYTFNQASKIIFENNQISVSTRLETYKSPNRSVVKNYLLLTITNKTNTKLTVKFKKKAFYNGVCSNCDSDESNFSIILNKKETIIGSPEKTSNKALRVFHSFESNESNSVLTKFEISNLQISKK